MALDQLSQSIESSKKKGLGGIIRGFQDRLAGVPKTQLDHIDKKKYASLIQTLKESWRYYPKNIEILDNLVKEENGVLYINGVNSKGTKSIRLDESEDYNKAEQIDDRYHLVSGFRKILEFTSALSGKSITFPWEKIENGYLKIEGDINEFVDNLNSSNELGDKDLHEDLLYHSIGQSCNIVLAKIDQNTYLSYSIADHKFILIKDFSHTYIPQMKIKGLDS